MTVLRRALRVVRNVDDDESLRASQSRYLVRPRRRGADRVRLYPQPGGRGKPNDVLPRNALTARIALYTGPLFPSDNRAHRARS